MMRDRIVGKDQAVEDWYLGGENMTTAEVAAYIRSILQGVRRLTGGRGRKDLDFLDYLLATAESEADTLSSRSYN